MPSRILREGINASRAVNNLTDEAEIFYRRLMSVVDDFGRFEAHPTLLRAALFAFQLDRWPESRIENALQECSEVFTTAGEPLIQVYETGQKKLLQINNFGQRTRTASKYPGPGDEPLQKRSGKIYFIQAARSKKIKIGYTETDPVTRLATLQTGSAESLVLLGYFTGNARDEREAHKLLSVSRLTGEWFSPSEDVINYIAANCRSLPQDDSDVAVNCGPHASRARSDAEAESNAESYSKSESKSYANANAEVHTNGQPPPLALPFWKLDESYAPMVAAWRSGKADAIDEDFSRNYKIWAKMNHDQQEQAIGHLLERVHAGLQTSTTLGYWLREDYKRAVVVSPPNGNGARAPDKNQKRREEVNAIAKILRQ